MPSLEPALFDKSLDRLAHGHSRNAPASGKLALAGQALAHAGRLDQIEQADTQVMGLRARARSSALPQHQRASQARSGVGAADAGPPLLDHCGPVIPILLRSVETAISS